MWECLKTALYVIKDGIVNLFSFAENLPTPQILGE
jgi:hypothetical protein